MQNGFRNLGAVWLPGRHEIIDRALFRTGRAFKLDLSHGTNLLPTSPSISHGLSALDDRSAEVLDYGDPVGNPLLREVIAHYESQCSGGALNLDNVVMTAGAREALHWIYLALAENGPHNSALVIGPQYPAIHAAIASAKLMLLELLGSADDFFEPTVKTVCDTILSEGPNLIVHITNPGNPSGRLWGKDECVELLHAVAETQSRLVIDKVCSDVPTDFMPQGPRILELAAQQGISHQLVLIDSFSKRRSLAGLRIGYLVSMDPVVVEWITRRIYGGTQACLPLEGLIEDLTESARLFTPHSETHALAKSSNLYRTISENHRVMRENRATAELELRPWLHSLSSLDAGQNVMARLDFPSKVTDVELVLALLDDGVGSYPISCFLAPGNVAAEAMTSIRLTLSTPPDLFRTTCQKARDAFAKLAARLT